MPSFEAKGGTVGHYGTRSSTYSGAGSAHTTIPMATMDSGYGAGDLGQGEGLSVRLQHEDFLPEVRNDVTPPNYENHSSLVKRANVWLGRQYGVRVVGCCTPVWAAPHPPSAAHGGRPTDTLHEDGPHTLTWLRVWYVQEEDPELQRVTAVLYCVTHVPRREEVFSQFVHRVNKLLKDDFMDGMIVSAETVVLFNTSTEFEMTGTSRALQFTAGDGPAVDVEATYARRDQARGSVRCLRLYSLYQGETVPESIGFHDVLATETRVGPTFRGYERFSELLDNASNWVAKERSIRVTNLQTLRVTQIQEEAFQERCWFSERGAGDTQLSRLRVFYTMPRAETPPDYMDRGPCGRITYRTFSPHLLSGSCMSGSRTESMVEVISRANMWLGSTGAQVFGVEWLPALHQKGYPGAEVTHTRLPRNPRHQHHLRLYLHGEYVETPGALKLVDFSQKGPSDSSCSVL